MNVLMIANSVGGYGANNSMLDMIEPLQRRGIRITVLLPGYGVVNRELQRRGICYYVLPYEMSTSVYTDGSNRWKNILGNFSLISEAEQIVKEKRIEVIHTNASNVDFGAVLALQCRLPHVWHVRELLYEDYCLKYDFPLLQRFFYHKAAAVITISKYVAQKRKFGKNNYTIYNGIDLKKYMFEKEECFSTEKIKVLYCGFISEEKGTMDAVRALHRLIERGYRNFQLDIVGSENAYSQELKRYVQKNNLTAHIFFHGYQANVQKFRKNADVALMCSRSEALGRVTIESMLSGCLVIGAAAGATPELITDGKTGYLYEVGNIEQLVSKLLLVDRDRDKSKDIISNAKKSAITLFDSEQYADKLYEIYTRVKDKF